MKTNRYDRGSMQWPAARVGRHRSGRVLVSRGLVKLGLLACGTVIAAGLVPPGSSHADQSRDVPENQQTASAPPNRRADQSDPRAVQLLQQMLAFIGNGPAFDAKVRETVWTSDRSVVGVGTYEQSGGGSGQYNLQVTMHDGDGKHRMQQISDGKLAWTRTEIAGDVKLRRVDVARLEEWVRGTTGPTKVSPKLKVGGWGEMLDKLGRHYLLSLRSAKLQLEPDQPLVTMRVIIGDLKPARRNEILSESKRDQWPALFPTRIHVAVKATPDQQTGLGHLVPAQIEFWSDPLAMAGEDGKIKQQRRMISLIELYSLRPITPPPVERFRFENQDAEVNFVNETSRYVEAYGVNLTRGQRSQLYR